MFEGFEHLSRCFCEKSPAEKRRLMAELDPDNEKLLHQLSETPVDDPVRPPQQSVGYPEKPTLVDARQLPKRSLRHKHGRGAFFHAICHIEFTAINLALDAALRFPGMPIDYYRDWLQIAKEEAAHFGMVVQHLGDIGYCYGDFDAHDGMWQLAERTSHDILMRMALVPRVLEARGLDVTPAMIERLQQAKDLPGAALLKQIYEDEIQHVAAGTRWLQFAAKLRGLDPERVFFDFVQQEFGQLRLNQFNQAGRLQAGFSPSELKKLKHGKTHSSL